MHPKEPLKAFQMPMLYMCGPNESFTPDKEVRIQFPLHRLSCREPQIVCTGSNLFGCVARAHSNVQNRQNPIIPNESKRILTIATKTKCLEVWRKQLMSV